MSRTLGTNRAFYILLAVSLLLLFLILGLFTKMTPLAVSHVLYDCKEAMEGLAAITLPHSFQSLLTLVLFFVIFAGILLLVYQYFKTRTFLDSILRGKIAAPGKVRDLILELGFDGQVCVTRNNTFPSFCYGLISPKICLSLNLVKTLTRGELKAVLIHESYHLKNKDPLKILLSRAAVAAFFFVPILKDFLNYYALSKELSADQLVVKSDSLKDLKTALTKSLGGLTVPNLSSIASFAGDNTLEQRVNALTIPDFKTGINISFVKLLVSALTLTLAFGILNLPLHAMENGNGTHSYYIMSQENMQMASCFTENSSEELSSPLNYSSKP